MVLVSVVVLFFKKIHPTPRSAHVGTGTGTRSAARRPVKATNGTGTGKFPTDKLCTGFVLFQNASVPVSVRAGRIFFPDCQCFLKHVCTGMLPVLRSVPSAPIHADPDARCFSKETTLPILASWIFFKTYVIVACVRDLLYVWVRLKRDDLDDSKFCS